MSRVSNQQELMPSLIDRLIDPESGGTTARRGYGPLQMAETVRRDLEDLLNTRQSHMGLPEAFVETTASLVAYGLPDLTMLGAVTSDQRQDIARLIEGIINRFEPRLRDVKARLVEGGSPTDRRVKFHIDARLSVDPAPEVAFDTILELSTGHYSVKPTQT